jgi:hypothetical protein
MAGTREEDRNISIVEMSAGTRDENKNVSIVAMSDWRNT